MMIPLPIDPVLPTLIERLGDAHASLAGVLVAPPGTGKSTRVPPAILRAGLFSSDHPNLVMLQPRRVAAQAVAARIAQEQGWSLGREVGYHIRFDRRLNDQTRLRILTEGVFTRQLLSDPFLEGIGAVILDEFHERHLETDLAIAFLKEIRQTVRPDLMVLVMSATLEAEPVAKFLGNCPIVEAQGQTYPISIEYLPTTPGHANLPDRITQAVEQCLSKPDPNDSSTGEGHHLLIFLPGVGEIQRMMQRLEPVAARWNARLMPLHGSLPPEEQQRALAPSHQRKIILATNIAETSLTIDGVRTVIDTGLVRMARFDKQRGLDRLDLERISQASADQRAGRAGRTAAGRVIRLWSAKQHHHLSAFTPPEIQRVDLAGTILALHAWGSTNPHQFGWYEPPTADAINSAEAILRMLGTLQSQRGEDVAGDRLQLTSSGRQILRLPLHPRLGRLLVAATHSGLPDAGCEIAALLSEKDILRRDDTAINRTHEVTSAESDLLYRLALLEPSQAGVSAQVDRAAVRRVRQVARQLKPLTRRMRRRNSSADIPAHEANRETYLMQALLLAYPDRVCRRRSSDPSCATMVGGGAVRLAATSIVRHAEYFLALDARHDPHSPTQQAMVHLASAIQVEWLQQLLPKSIHQATVTDYDTQKDRVFAVNRIHYHDLLIAEQTGAPMDPQAARNALLAAAGPMADTILRTDPAADQLLNRIEFIRRHGQLSIDLPPATELLAAMATGKRSIEELKRADWTAAIHGIIPYNLRYQLERLAPAGITLPNGKSWRLDYPRGGGTPVLAVRLQQLFGQRQTPRIAGGTVPVLLHILAPNGRPVQITDDLESFWKNTYAQVRKDLRSRYPKHAWPEQPPPR